MLQPTEREQVRAPLFTRQFVILCLHSFVLYVSFYIFLPTLPLYQQQIGGQIWEIGVLGAMGLKPNQISLLFILEGIMIGLVGVAVGIIFGLAINGYLMSIGLDFSSFSNVTSYMALMQTRVYPTWGIEKLLMRASMIAIISALAALIPAVEAGRREPAEALHFV